MRPLAMTGYLKVYFKAGRKLPENFPKCLLNEKPLEGHHHQSDLRSSKSSVASKNVEITQ